MQPLKNRTASLEAAVAAAVARLDIPAKKLQIEQLQTQVAAPEIWNNPQEAQVLTKKLADLQSIVEPWLTLEAQVRDITELMALGDDSLEVEFDGQISALEREYEDRSKELYFDGPHDTKGAIVRLSPGVGGTDAQDFAEMLERMYLRWADKVGIKAHVIERSAGDGAGIKSSIIEMTGPYAYGKLRSENGVHRLVRLSPFNSDNLRQTSFALVEVLPDIDAPDEVAIDNKDLKIDVYRAGGHGGQSVNTTDSAVRVTHIPTGIVVAIQNERSQLQNKETALKILRSKLAQLLDQERKEKVSELQAGKSADWGSQIRNYVLHPYTLVKDTRTKYEEHDTQAVLDGKLDGFIDAYLSQPK